MSQLIETLGNNAEYIGMVAGASAGVLNEYLATNVVARNRLTLSGEMGIALDQQESSRIKRIGALVLTPILFAGAALGGYNAVAWESSGTDSRPPLIGLVVDHSGATEFGEPKSIDTINTITETFDADDMNVKAFVADTGDVRTVPVGKVAEQPPFGDAPLGVAFEQAMGRIEEDQQKAVGEVQNTAAATVVTNGNGFGDKTAVINRANEMGTPVFVVNVEGEENNPSTMSDFKEIAKATKGQYFSVTRENVKSMIDKINQKLEASKLKSPKSNNWPRRVLAGLFTVGTFGLYYRKRSSMTLANHQGRN